MKKKCFLILLCFVWLSPQSFAKEHSTTDTNVGEQRQSKLMLVMTTRLQRLESEQRAGESRQSKLKLVMKIRGNNNNDPKNVSGKDLAILKILAKNLLGHKKLWRILFETAPRMWMEELRKQKKRKASIVKLKRQLKKLDNTVATVKPSENVAYSEDEESVDLVSNNNEDSQNGAAYPVVEVTDPVAEVNLETKAEESATPTTATIPLRGAYSIVGPSPSGIIYLNDDSGTYSVNTFRVEKGNTIGDVINSTEEFQFEKVSSNVNVQTDTTGYSYTTWGEWNGEGRTYNKNGFLFNIDHSHLVAGLSTKDYPGGEIPKTGIATYNGTLRGDYIVDSNQTIELNAIGGNITLNANFGSQTMSGSLSATRNGSAWVSTNLVSQNFADSEGYYDVTSDGADGVSVSLYGTFYGPNAEETGGSFWIIKNGESGGASGVYRAKQ